MPPFGPDQDPAPDEIMMIPIEEPGDAHMSRHDASFYREDAQPYWFRDYLRYRAVHPGRWRAWARSMGGVYRLERHIDWWYRIGGTFEWDHVPTSSADTTAASLDQGTSTDTSSMDSIGLRPDPSEAPMDANELEQVCSYCGAAGRHRNDCQDCEAAICGPCSRRNNREVDDRCPRCWRLHRFRAQHPRRGSDDDGRGRSCSHCGIWFNAQANLCTICNSACFCGWCWAEGIRTCPQCIRDYRPTPTNDGDSDD